MQHRKRTTARATGRTAKKDARRAAAREDARAAFLLWWSQMAGLLEKLYQDICHLNAEVNRPGSLYAGVFEFNDLRELEHDLSHAACQMIATTPTVPPTYPNPLAVLAAAK